LKLIKKFGIKINFFSFRNYNDGMGGVDLLDNLVACYRVLYRIKKWWFPIYIWSLSVCAVNGWRLRMRVCTFLQ